MNKKQKKVLARIIIAAVLMIILYFIPAKGIIRFLLYMVPYLVIGYDILKKAFKGIKNKQVFDENFLMAVATVGAIAVALYENGDYTEAIAVMLFYQIGELFQSYAVGKSRKNISELMDIRPDYANIEVDGKLTQVDPDEVAIGSVIVVQPGEKVPIDGVIVEGSSTLNTSALTGESVPRDAKCGDEIISGCINMSGVLKIKTTKEFGESTVSKILDLVENSSSKKSKSENFISKFAKYYTPAVCYSALALAILPPLVRILFMSAAPQWGSWIYRALTFLVISCPCALVISIPLSFFAGIGGASREGVLVKGSNYLETLSQTRYVVFDKTGTLTHACPVVARVIPFGGHSADDMLRVAACLEEHFPHPVARAVVRKAEQEGLHHQEEHTEVEYVVAHGIASRLHGKRVLFGSRHYIHHDEGVPVDAMREDIERLAREGRSILYLAVDGKLAGLIAIEDPLRPEAAPVIRKLLGRGIRVVMLTGDDERTAAAVAVTGAAIVALDKLLNEKDPLHVESVEFPEDAELDSKEAAKAAEAYAEGEAKAEAAAPAEEAAPEAPAAEQPAEAADEPAAPAANEPVTLPAPDGEKPVYDPEAPNPNPVEAGPAEAPRDETGKFDPTKIADASDFGDWEEQGCKG